MKKTARCGSWKSPIASDLIVKESIGLSQVRLAGDDIYWIEMRPSEAGRQVVVWQKPDGERIDMTPAGFNARTRVHEYGGGDYVVQEGVVYFSNFADQQLYRVAQDQPPELTSHDCDDARVRYADYVLDKSRQRLICVREDHRANEREPANELVAIPLTGGESRVLVSGNDFYSSPRVSHDGSRLAWLTWNHPNMPWDGCELWVGEFDRDGSITNARMVAGDKEESIFQPEWSPDGQLFFVSDRTGWWNIYREGPDGSSEIVCEASAEFGAPQWIFGLSTYSFSSSEKIVCAFVERGIWQLGEIDVASRTLARIDTPYTEISFMSANAGRAVFRAGSTTEPLAIVDFDLAARSANVLQRASHVRSEEHTSELQSLAYLVCRLLLEK